MSMSYSAAAGADGLSSTGTDGSVELGHYDELWERVESANYNNKFQVSGFNRVAFPKDDVNDLTPKEGLTAAAFYAEHEINGKVIRKVVFKVNSRPKVPLWVSKELGGINEASKGDITFEEECRLIKAKWGALSSSQYLTKPIAVSKSNDVIVLEYGGRPISEKVFTRGTILDMMRNVFRAQQDLQKAGLRHGDMHWENILWEKDGFRLTDIGSIQPIFHKCSTQCEVHGSPNKKWIDFFESNDDSGATFTDVLSDSPEQDLDDFSVVLSEEELSEEPEAGPHCRIKNYGSHFVRGTLYPIYCGLADMDTEESLELKKFFKGDEMQEFLGFLHENPDPSEVLKRIALFSNA